MDSNFIITLNPLFFILLTKIAFFFLAEFISTLNLFHFKEIY